MDKVGDSSDYSNFGEILRKSESVNKDERMADDLERRLCEITRQRYGSQQETRWNITRLPFKNIFAAVAVLLLAIGTSWYYRKSNDTVKHIPPIATLKQSTILPINFLKSNSSADEMRVSLLQMIKESTLIVSGKIRSGANDKEEKRAFFLDVDNVLKGKITVIDLSISQNENISCPVPPKFVSGVWVILFTVKGRIWTDQWKLEFGDKESYVLFCDRVRGYLDRSIIPTLTKELLSGGGKLPFSQKDRLLTDLGFFKGDEVIRGLIRHARLHKGEPGNYLTVYTIGTMADASHFEFFKEVFEQEGWIPDSKGHAIASLAKYNKHYIDEWIVSKISDTTQEMIIRRACMQAAVQVKHFGIFEALVLILNTEANSKTRDLYDAAIRSLGELGDDRGVSLLLTILHNGNDYYGDPGNAALALAKFDDLFILVDLREALQQKLSDYSN